MRATRTIAGPLGAVLLLVGCNFAPHYEPPKSVPTTAFKEAVPGNVPAQGWKPAEPRDAEIRNAWWEVYQDSELNDLESRVAISNQTVAGAEANYRAARALVQKAEAAYFPTLTLDPSVVRSRASAAEVLPGGVPGTTTPGTGVTTGATTTSVGGASTTPRTIYSFPLEASYLSLIHILHSNSKRLFSPAGHRPIERQHHRGSRNIIPADATEDPAPGSNRQAGPGRRLGARVHGWWRGNDDQYRSRLCRPKAPRPAQGVCGPDHQPAAPEARCRAGRDPVPAGGSGRPNWRTAEQRSIPVHDTERQLAAAKSLGTEPLEFNEEDSSADRRE